MKHVVAIAKMAPAKAACDTSQYKAPIGLPTVGYNSPKSDFRYDS